MVKIIPTKLIKITCSNGKEYIVQIDDKGCVIDKTKEAPDWWINWDIKELEKLYKLDHFSTWIFHF